MTAKELMVLKARIKEETTNMQNLLNELRDKNLLKNEDNESIYVGDDSFTLRAIGSILHDFYVAAENVFEMISREIDESTPQGLDWHLKLLKQMNLQLEAVRPAVISKETLVMLDKYRAFRHVFRNVYGFNLDTGRLRDLLEEMPLAVDSLTKDLTKFIRNMENIINAVD
ncbi:ribonuclease toxin HepT-like protein [Dethiobacter alkaliphilus]|uniref:ribonuclease toxin HepT-like protein n=1 Tax=Dethiobacter alkaliphilus TaxID=427926 RepID=UPI0022273922|nr:hypothetical protein [Dethiobacter alkaliphilus]MCW3490402.1 hypothetical protein [Dethiobacter alkaliphilus]